MHTAAALMLLLTFGGVVASHQHAVEPSWLFLAAAFGLLLVSVAGRKPLPSVRALLLWALALRLVAVGGQPILEDDFYRYLWDGYRLVVDGNPYGRPPADWFGDTGLSLQWQLILNQINNPGVPTIYAPVQQFLFAVAYLIDPGRLWPLQLLLSLTDAALIWLLWQLGARQGAWLYALSPLVLKEIAFTAHPDGFGAALLMLAIHFRLRTNPAAASISAGLAAACKVFAWPLLPFLLWRLPPRYWLLTAAVAALFYWPFIGGATDAAGLKIFASHWVFNPAIYDLIQQALGTTADQRLARAICGLIYAACWLGLLWRFHRATQQRWELPRGDLILGSLLLLAPVINPWYLLWVLPFAAIRPSLSAWAASALLLLSYAHAASGDYSLPRGLRLLEFLPLLLTLAWDLWRHRQGADRKQRISGPESTALGAIGAPPARRPAPRSDS